MSKRQLLVIDAGTMFTPYEKISPARVVIDGPTIIEAGPVDRVTIPALAQRIDGSQLVLTPGFIDPHVHGSAGRDVMEGSFEALNTISRALARHGTTSFLATTVSAPPNILSETLSRLGPLLTRTFAGATPLGIHLEGPFICGAKRGTHPGASIMDPDSVLLGEWISASKSSIRLLTLAPELAGSQALVTLALAQGVRVAMGHSDATLDEATAAAEYGVHYAVHTFNAMRQFLPRDPGIIGAVLSDDRIFAEIIADGVHVHPSVVRFFAKAKGPERILLVTDAISATGMPEGNYPLGRETVTVLGGICRDHDGHLAGSTLTQDTALRNFMNWSGFSLQESLLALTVNPAKALGLPGKGMIEPGADADLTFMDARHRVVRTFVGGNPVFDGAPA